MVCFRYILSLFLINNEFHFFSVMNLFHNSSKNHLLPINYNINFENVLFDKQFFKDDSKFFVCIYHIAKSIQNLHQHDLWISFSFLKEYVIFEVFKNFIEIFRKQVFFSFIKERSKKFLFKDKCFEKNKRIFKEREYIKFWFVCQILFAKENSFSKISLFPLMIKIYLLNLVFAN